MNQVTRQKAIKLLANCNIASALDRIKLTASLPDKYVMYYVNSALDINNFLFSVNYSEELRHISRSKNTILWEYRRELDDYKLIDESFDSVSDLYLLKLLHMVSEALPDDEELKSFVAECNRAISKLAIDYLINHKGLKDCMISLITTDIKVAHAKLVLTDEMYANGTMRVKLAYKVGQYSDFICLYVKEPHADGYEFIFSAYYGESEEELAPLLYRKHYHFSVNNPVNDLSYSAISYLAQTLELKIFN